MRAVPAAIATAILLLILNPAHASADIALPGSPHYANRMMNGFVTPTVKPGQNVDFSFNLTNPYDNASGVMEDIVLTMGVYRYATQETSREVNSSFKHPPLLDGLSNEVNRTYSTLGLGDTLRIGTDIDTSKKTPHGSYFSQSTYFMRFKLAFHFIGNATPIRLQSRGWFAADQWDKMVSFSGNESIVNTTYMRSLGVDGLLPDSSFGIKVPIPHWPLALLIAGCCGVLFAALYNFVLDNPGKYPKLEKRFYYLRGKLSELRSELEYRRGK